MHEYESFLRGVLLSVYNYLKEVYWFLTLTILKCFFQLGYITQDIMVICVVVKTLKLGYCSPGSSPLKLCNTITYQEKLLYHHVKIPLGLPLKRLKNKVVSKLTVYLQFGTKYSSTLSTSSRVQTDQFYKIDNRPISVFCIAALQFLKLSTSTIKKTQRTYEFIYLKVIV